MLSIDEYIARRKEEDNLNEFDTKARMENTRLCVNYVFEYFNNFIDIKDVDKKTKLHQEKLDKYQLQFKDYKPDVQEWLVNIYSEYNIQINIRIKNICKENSYFYLFDDDSEFRSLAYECQARLVKKCPFLADQAEMIFKFIKDYYKDNSERHARNSGKYICESIDHWINDTWEYYQVSIEAFVYEWIQRFSNNSNLWPPTHKKRSLYEWQEYAYDYRQKSNLFGIDSLYSKMPKKPYTKGKKQAFEALILRRWVYCDEAYWNEYARKVLPTLE
ncbi:hypothetical protein [Sporomusa sp.]|uniref:hypothetical protein n=1 Tax=Sporomusa sp. TaxID=2078658 RepID=UPI002C4E1D10|nr:hypothetical protein [Sporomusa sp.]HWR45289.1 hypothetical protein [Sporomusa sp.]